MVEASGFEGTAPAPGLAAQAQRSGRTASGADVSGVGWERGRTIGAVCLGVIVACSLFMVILVADRPSSLSAISRPHFYPGWLAGPLGGLWPQFPRSSTAVGYIFTGVVALMYVSYLVALGKGRLRARWVVGAIVVLHVIFFLAPPLTMTDVFNYINYARMEMVHHLNPYATIPVLEPHSDPSYALSNWHQLLSPYGPLFTIMSFAIVPLGVAGSFWAVKGGLALFSLGVLALVWGCARLLGRDPVKAVAFAGLNPIVLLWGLGGDHNDFIMIFFILLGCWLLLWGQRREEGEKPPQEGQESLGVRLGGRVGEWTGMPGGEVLSKESGERAGGPDRKGGGLAAGVGGRVAKRALAHPGGLEIAAGAAFAASVFVKASAAVIVPVVLAALFSKAPRRGLWMMVGGAVASAVLGLLSFLAFGANIPDIGTQGSIVTNTSLPNLLGLILGQGGETETLRVLMMAALVVSIGLCCVAAWRSKGDFITGAGWATLALLMALAWVLPWYVVWVLPLAALSRSHRLRVVTIALTIYMMLVWVPAAPHLFRAIGFNPGGTPLGQLHHRYVKQLLN